MAEVESSDMYCTALLDVLGRDTREPKMELLRAEPERVRGPWDVG